MLNKSRSWQIVCPYDGWKPLFLTSGEWRSKLWLQLIQPSLQYSYFVRHKNLKNRGIAYGNKKLFHLFDCLGDLSFRKARVVQTFHFKDTKARNPHFKYLFNALHICKVLEDFLEQTINQCKNKTSIIDGIMLTIMGQSSHL